MKKDTIIIDAHSHFGSDYFHGDIDIIDYIELMNKVNIDYSLLMPPPTPVKLISNLRNKYLGWYIDKNKIFYYSDIVSTDIKNPYKEVNYNYHEIIKKTNKTNLFFIPLVHPILDSGEYLEQLVNDLDPIAFKIHGIGGGIDPKMIPNTFSNVIKKYDIPLIIHTDYDNGKNIIRYDTFLLRNLNTPANWVKYLYKEKIKAVLNHGCALDKNTLNDINADNLIKVGLGPDLVMNQDLNRLFINNSYQKKIDYLKCLKKILVPSKIVFDIDFNWNIDPKNDEMDMFFLNRIANYWTNLNEQQLIYSENILQHFDKLKTKIMKEEKNGKIK